MGIDLYMSQFQEYVFSAFSSAINYKNFVSALNYAIYNTLTSSKSNTIYNR